MSKVSDSRNDKVFLCNIVFSRREIEVLALICNGYSSKSVSSFLNLSPNTVNSYVRNIVMKSGCMSMEHLSNAITVSGDRGYLNDIYGRLIYKSEFDDFIATYKVTKPLNIMICYGVCNGSDIEQMCEVFEKIGCLSVEVNTSNVDPSFKKILVKTKDDVCIVEDKFDFVMNMGDDGLYLSLLKCLKSLTEDDELDVQINKYFAAVKVESGNSSFKWREKVNKYVGIAVSASCSIMLVGYLYGLYPRMSDVITNQELFFVNKDYYKRTSLLEQIKAILDREANINVVTLVGPGGAGKTTLARMIMNQYNDENYDVVYEMNVESQAALIGSVERFCQRIVSNNHKLAEQFRELIDDKDVQRKLEHMIGFMKDQLKKVKNWAIVLDNLNEPKLVYSILQLNDGYKNGKIIITTRDQTISQDIHLGNNIVVNVSELRGKEKYGLFNKVAGNVAHGRTYTKDDIDLLLSRVPGYPLDVASVACCIAGSNMTPAEYLKRMAAETNEFKAVNENLMRDSTSYGKTRYGIVVATLDSILAEIKNDHLMKGALLILSMCDSQDIPDKLFDRYGEAYPGFRDKMIRLLQKYSFITRGKNSTSIHRVIQDMWFTLLCNKLSAKEIETALLTFIDKSLKFEEVMHLEHRSNLIQSDREYYAKLEPTLEKIVELADRLPDKVRPEVKYRAKAMALAGYAIWAKKSYGSVQKVCELFEQILNIDDKYRVLTSIERAMIMYLYSYSLGNTDIKKAWRLIHSAESVANNTRDAEPFQCMCKLHKSFLYSIEGMYGEAVKHVVDALNIAFAMRTKYPTDFWPKKIYAQMKYAQMALDLESKLNDIDLAKIYSNDIVLVLSLLNAAEVGKKPVKRNELNVLVPILKKWMIFVCNRAEKYEEAAKAYEDAKYVYEHYLHTSVGIFLEAKSRYCDTLLRTGRIEKAYQLSAENLAKLIRIEAPKRNIIECQAYLAEACLRLQRYNEAIKLAAEAKCPSLKNTVVEQYARCMFCGLVSAYRVGNTTYAKKFGQELFAALTRLANGLNIQVESVNVENIDIVSCINKAKAAFKGIYGDHGFVKDFVMKM